MRSNDEIAELLRVVKEGQADIKFRETEIYKEYQQNEGNSSGIIVNILAIVGGILATIAFLAFLLIAGLYKSSEGQLVLGFLLVIGATWMSKQSERVFLDTLSVSAFISGLILIGMGLGVNEHFSDPNQICVVYIVIALLVMLIAQTYILSFISVLIVGGSIQVLIFNNLFFNLVGIYTLALSVVISFMVLHEATIIKSGKRMSKLYNPLLMGFLVLFVVAFGSFGVGRYMEVPLLQGWIPSIVIIGCIMYVIHHLLKTLEITSRQQQLLIYGISLLALLPTIMAPAISGSILILLLAFYVNHRVAFVIGVVSFIYFVIQYYYDLEVSLLIKSIILFVSGLFFTGLFLLTFKKLSADEKV